MNRLAAEKSPYLRHAAAQPIDWYPWGDEAFAAAAREDKALFLSSGAVWCHWCHVMAEESFTDPAVARILNDNFISIKLDRDERPDIDRRLQRAAAASGAGGGWPLTVFLTPDKRPFFIGTYFPKEDAYGRPGFTRILKTIADVYRTKRGEIDDYARRLAAASRSRVGEGGEVSPGLLDEAAGVMLSQFDSKNGGFGAMPKFPMPGALEFLMQRYAMTGNGVLANAVRRTLSAMARGGLQDQLGGGFHRYSTDEAWSVPHFEKMADDNAWLLKNYTDAYALFNEPAFRDAALGIVRFAREVLSDPSGGFYASQDADVTPDDEGGYFTWTVDELRAALTDDEYRVLSLHFLDEAGTVHHDPSKKVLLIAMTADEVAGRLGMESSRVDALIASGKAKLMEERRKRTPPFLDKTLYTSLNGMFIAAFFRAFRVLRDKAMETFALASLARITHERLLDHVLYHAEGVRAFLDDYAALIDAAVEAYEVTGLQPHLELACRLMDQTIERFWDKGSGAFFDAEGEVLGSRHKGSEDIPQPSANSMAIMLLIKLSAILKNTAYRDYAEAALKALAPEARRSGVHGGYFFAALDAFYHLISLDFEGRPDALIEEGLAIPKPFSAVGYRPGRGRLIPCLGTVCYDPIETTHQLKAFFEEKPFLTTR